MIITWIYICVHACMICYIIAHIAIILAANIHACMHTQHVCPCPAQIHDYMRSYFIFNDKISYTCTSGYWFHDVAVLYFGMGGTSPLQWEVVSWDYFVRMIATDDIRIGYLSSSFGKEKKKNALYFSNTCRYFL